MKSIVCRAAAHRKVPAGIDAWSETGGGVRMAVITTSGKKSGLLESKPQKVGVLSPLFLRWCSAIFNTPSQTLREDTRKKTLLTLSRL